MTLRGRLTIAAGSALLVGLAGGLGRDAVRGCPRAAESPRPIVAVPAVSAAPPVASPSLLAAVPVGREALGKSDPRSDALVLERPASPELGDSAVLRVHTHLSAELTRQIWRILDRGRVSLGHVLVLEPATGALRGYVSTDPERFPPTRSYPAASLIKVVTTAAALDAAPDVAHRACRYAGNPYRLTRRGIHPPARGRQISLRRALATSNNQCFAQLAVHRIGSAALLDAIDRFGFLHEPAPGHAPGRVDDPGEDVYALGLLGSGLDGARITPLHAVQLAGVLADGVRRDPRWIARIVDDTGRELALPPSPAPVRVLTRELAADLREMLVDTTQRGTARRAFRTRRGRPLLQGIRVAGKTGSLSGENPEGRYEWFVGVAPAEEPVLAVAVVAVQGSLYWMTASQVAAEVFKTLFCPQGVCRVDAAERWRGPDRRPGMREGG